MASGIHLAVGTRQNLHLSRAAPEKAKRESGHSNHRHFPIGKAVDLRLPTVTRRYREHPARHPQEPRCSKFHGPCGNRAANGGIQAGHLFRSLPVAIPQHPLHALISSIRAGQVRHE